MPIQELSVAKEECRLCFGRWQREMEGLRALVEDASQYTAVAFLQSVHARIPEIHRAVWKTIKLIAHSADKAVSACAAAAPANDEWRGRDVNQKPPGQAISNELRAQLIARDRLDRVRGHLVRLEDLIQESEKYKGVLFRGKMKMPCLRFYASVRNLGHAITALCAVKERR